MLKSEIEATLAQTLEDFVLSTEERRALRIAFEPFQSDISTLQYARNKAFALVRQQIARSPEGHMEALKWLEGVIKIIDSVKQEQSVKKSRAYFSPGTSCVDKIIASLNSVKESVDICVFTISDDVISKAIIGAHERGVKVRIITDDEKVTDKGSDITEFISRQIQVKTDDSPSHMHHKFAIFDQQVLLNGSFNWTRSASRNNNENIIVDSTPHLVASFQQTFDALWEEFIDLVEP